MYITSIFKTVPKDKSETKIVVVPAAKLLSNVGGKHERKLIITLAFSQVLGRIVVYTFHRYIYTELFVKHRLEVVGNLSGLCH